MIYGRSQPGRRDNPDEERFLADMIGEGFDASEFRAELQVRRAMEWAKARGESWGGGYWLAEFRSGTYIEKAGVARWFPGLGRLKAFDQIREERLNS